MIGRDRKQIAEDINCALVIVTVVNFLLHSLCHYRKKRFYKLNHTPLAFKRLSEGQERLREMGDGRGREEGGRKEIQCPFCFVLKIFK